MPGRVEQVRRLLLRYADARGQVATRAVDGVIRLAGLNAREAAEVRAVARVRYTSAAPAETAPAENPAPGTADRKPSKGDEGFADAVAAAMSVLQVDRIQRRPENRILSAEAEVGLAVLVRGGADRVAREPEESELQALPADDLRIQARNCFVLHNQRLVHSLVRQYQEQGLEYDDLFQHGVLGLMRAARKFDPTMGNKFSTYATWWVRQSVSRAVADEGAIIRIPVHMHEQMRKVANAERTLAAQGKPAGPADVAVLCDLNLAKVEEARRLSRRTDSLDRVVGDGATLGDFVGRMRPLPSVEETVVNHLVAEQAMAVVDTFTGRDHRILVRRLGLDGNEPSTLEELGREFGVSRERIRQVESKLRPRLKERLRMASIHPVPEPEEASAPRAVAPPPDSAGQAESETPVPGAGTIPADWKRARQLAKTPSEETTWLVEYALAALGSVQLAALLGPDGADTAMRYARSEDTDDRGVVNALDVLRRVLDALVPTGMGPADFLGQPAEALASVTPRDYLARKPLVHSESRVALRDALREFLLDRPMAYQDAGEQQDRAAGEVEVAGLRGRLGQGWM